jgi:VWFA-related protein
MRARHFTPALLLLALLASEIDAQRVETRENSLTVNANLVLVHALVKTRSGERVFALTEKDFALLDNGIPQTLDMEEDTDLQPLALAVVVQTGGRGAAHLKDYRHLEPLLEAIIGNVRYLVAVIRFDSAPHLELDFSEGTEDAANRIANLSAGDDGAATLDAIEYGIERLRALPARYRRTILLMSETTDLSSKSTVEDAVQILGETNTRIYSLAFSSARANIAHHAAKIPVPGGTTYSHTPYAPDGCMSRAPNADPDAHENRAIQAWDCAGDLLPPLRLAELAFVAAKEEMRRNGPETVAQLTGGEYFAFSDAKSLEAHLTTIMNDVPNYYVLRFRPSSPAPGPHVLRLKVGARPDLVVAARSSYYIGNR